MNEFDERGSEGTGDQRDASRRRGPALTRVVTMAMAITFVLTVVAKAMPA